MTRVFHGILITLTYHVYYAYFIESLTTAQRSRVGSLDAILNGLSPCFIALVAYFARDWRLQIYLVGGLNGAVLLLFWFIPKSKEWLATQTASTEEESHETDRWEQVKLALKGNMLQFKMIIESPPVLRVSFVMVRIVFVYFMNKLNC